ncbi:MAG TPA: hypothetical protein VKU84_16525 [Stellaceae bacterium]|nr:hypothetical protein [Stellaceae bacterium]
MALNDRYLKPMLDAGSSRVFNCNDIWRKHARKPSGTAQFFTNPRLHSLVLIKETNANGVHGATAAGQFVGTKLYFPYNGEDVYEGGRSVFLHHPHAMSVLREQFGLASTTATQEQLLRDLKILRILDQLPSLDGFLMRNALEQEGITVHESYFEIPEEERAAIVQYVRHKLEPLVQAAFGAESATAGKVSQLIDKLWEARDKEALGPLIEAFRFPEHEALTIFGSWNGITYYTFEYARAKDRRESFARWLRDDALPRNYVPEKHFDHIGGLLKETVRRLRWHWSAVENVSRKYETLYARFLSERDGVTDFIAFLRRSRELYWRMGDSLSKMNHAIHCWDINTKEFPARRLPSDHLAHILGVLRTVLVSEEPAASEVVWDQAAARAG